MAQWPLPPAAPIKGDTLKRYTSETGLSTSLSVVTYAAAHVTGQKRTHSVLTSVGLIFDFQEHSPLTQQDAANRVHTYIPSRVRHTSGQALLPAMCPLRLIPKIFVFDEEEVPAELRAQRTLNRARVPEIASYLVDNPQSYTLSSITASVNGSVSFTPMSDTGVGQNMGSLSIPMEAQILINDGQHRRAAIEQAIAESSELGHDHISVLFFIDEGLKRSQQMFADLNKNAVRPSDSLNTLYDHRDQLAETARYLVKQVAMFSRLTELEKSSISNRSTKLFTISSIRNANRALLQKSQRDTVSSAEMDSAADYWRDVTEAMPDWQAAFIREVNTSELRQNYVHAHGVALHALGHVGIPSSQEPAFTRPYTEEAQGHRLGQSELRLGGPRNDSRPNQQSTHQRATHQQLHQEELGNRVNRHRGGAGATARSVTMDSFLYESHEEMVNDLAVAGAPLNQLIYEIQQLYMPTHVHGLSASVAARTHHCLVLDLSRSCHAPLGKPHQGCLCRLFRYLS